VTIMVTTAGGTGEGSGVILRPDGTIVTTTTCSKGRSAGPG
jgi:hypothetical protein